MQEFSTSPDAVAGAHPSAGATEPKRSVKDRLVHEALRFGPMFVDPGGLRAFRAARENYSRPDGPRVSSAGLRADQCGRAREGDAGRGGIRTSTAGCAASRSPMRRRANSPCSRSCSSPSTSLKSLLWGSGARVPTPADSVPAIGGGFAGLLSVAAIMFVMLIPYFVFRGSSQSVAHVGHAASHITSRFHSPAQQWTVPIAERGLPAHPHALLLRRGDLVADLFSRDLALELGEGEQHVEREATHAGRRIERLGDGHERYALCVEDLDDLGRAERGVCSAGLRTIVQPAASAGASFNADLQEARPARRTES